MQDLAMLYAQTATRSTTWVIIGTHALQTDILKRVSHDSRISLVAFLNLRIKKSLHRFVHFSRVFSVYFLSEDSCSC
jgi:hypothetical protein